MDGIVMRGIATVGLLVAYSNAVAQLNVSAAEQPRPSIVAAELADKPDLDGNIVGDSAWEGVTPATGFTQRQPNEGREATQKTEVFIGYTDAALYIGVMAYDDDPSTIIVADSRRDSSLAETDSFQIIIDGLLDRQNGYVFGTNPAGVQYDAQVIKEGTAGIFGARAGGFNLNWDGSWNVVARLTDAGWAAEFEIPFTTLRYGKGDEQNWGINFQRNIRSNNEIVFWAPLNRQHDLNRVSEAGTVQGIRPPDSRNLQITPFVLASREEGGSINGSESDQEFGFDIKYSLTPSLTLDATYNTDFAQVEVDDVVVNLDRFSIFLPEKRPFFLENAGQFRVGTPQQVELFFSRRIGINDGAEVPINGGVRLSGTVGTGTNLGFLYMSDEGVPGVAAQNDYVVARVNQELPNRSSIGAIIVSRDGDGSINGSPSADQNQAYAIDGVWGIGETVLLQGYFAKTDTPGLNDDDFAFSVRADYDSPEWWTWMAYTEVREDFNPEVGFLRRDDYRRGEALIMRRFRPDGALLEVRPHISISNYWDLDGFLETGFQHYDVHWEFKNGYRIDTGVNYLKDGLQDPFEIIDGVFVPAGTYSGYEAQIHANTNRGAPLSFGFRSNIGERFGGDRVVLEPSVNFRVGETFSSELTYVYNEYDLPVVGGDFDVGLTRLRLSYSFTPQMLLQILVQHNDQEEVLSTNVRFSLLRTANSGLFVVYNEFDEQYPGAPPTGREFIIKYNYLFDVFK
ncbi:MAG: carbohydrate binding family 9 domain-containing protein [Gammaproteobacteria bacterium]|nr:carbohydrate binding family 9 domain-containing protein [Gammaproteobacteria bacterium]